MAITFYPHTEDAQKGSLTDRIGVLMEAAERYKAAVLDMKEMVIVDPAKKEPSAPKDIHHAYNWEEVAMVLRQVRELPEANKVDKAKKAELLTKLAEVYEVLRAAKMSKLEAVRLALMSEANQLRSGDTQVA